MPGSSHEVTKLVGQCEQQEDWRISSIKTWEMCNYLLHPMLMESQVEGLVEHNSSLQKPRDPKLICKNVIKNLYLHFSFQAKTVWSGCTSIFSKEFGTFGLLEDGWAVCSHLITLHFKTNPHLHLLFGRMLQNCFFFFLRSSRNVSSNTKLQLNRHSGE